MSVVRGVLWIVAVLFAVPVESLAAERQAQLYLFSSERCSACAREKEFLKGLAARIPELEIRVFEAVADPANAKVFARVAGRFGLRTVAVPTTFIGAGEPIVGYQGDATTGALIEGRVRACLERGCEDPVAALLAGAGFGGAGVARPLPAATPEAAVVELPLAGPTDLSRLPLLTLAVVLGGLDSFNPCTFFVLFTLLGILVHARSRRRMLFIGGTFVLFSGVAYFLFMAAWLNLFLHIGELRAVTAAAGAVALAIAGINVKDYFFFKRGISLMIPESRKPKLFERMRRLVHETSLPGLVLGTVVLAAAANTYELLCTAGFPLVFTRLLTLHKIPPAEHYLYLGLYNLVYVVPLACVVAVFSLTLGSRKLSETQGRVMKLVSGLMMLCLGLVLLFAPDLFSSALAGAGMLAAALLAAAMIVGAERVWRARGRRGSTGAPPEGSLPYARTGPNPAGRPPGPVVNDAVSGGVR